MIEYKRDIPLDLDLFIGLYRASTLAERRPAEDREVMRQMKDHASLTITAWDGDTLVGIARTLTDFAYAAYLADLAVAQSHQRRGVGKRLIEETRAALGPQCMMVLLAAPAASDYYAPLGFSHSDRAWMLRGDDALR
ncbi:MAG: GNAT family N-acetyltransferase [Halofilum sp. (in: g-proteobacteria)]